VAETPGKQGSDEQAEGSIYTPLAAPELCPTCETPLKLETDYCLDQHVAICSYLACRGCGAIYEPPGAEDG
jgi:hypothetical protein